MIQCPSCSREILDDSRICSYCGGAVQAAHAEPTVTAPLKPVHAAPQPAPPGSSSDSIDQARFTPGTMLTDRYRVVGLLGKGGMGEVYRADDLKLRQSVALKFLPAALSQDARKLERFHHEVRVARQVSHPNVCRVYDIGEADGQHFISMEYIDGEDLASVLRRMGKPSTDKAVQIARQLCAGLAAAHDKGVLHRDLKPHNVMIDGRGKVRITDFGLAGFVEDFAGKDVAAGTPAYMAPEQLAGREVSVKSDVYSLGLVLFELFTGTRMYEGTTPEQIERIRGAAAPATLTSSTEDLDPAIERIVLRCLEPEPAARPSSALAVAAALPGGDPLAAALAAGETPDPEMVAAAGGVGGLHPGVAVLCLLGVVAGLIGVALINNSTALFRKVDLALPPEALAFRATEVLKKLRHSDPPADTAFGFTQVTETLRHIHDTDKSPQRWDQLASNRPPGILFWYRQSPTDFALPDSIGNVSVAQPPLTVPGMATVTLDPDGRLHELAIVPPGAVKVPATDHTAVDWSILFAEAQLDLGAFEPTPPTWSPPVHCDQRAAWTGFYPERPDFAIRVEAGAYGGQPTFFRVRPKRNDESAAVAVPNSVRESVADYAFVSIIFAVLIGSTVLAWTNLQCKRGDRKGAFRAGAIVFVGFMAMGVLSSRHAAQPWILLERFTSLCGLSLYFAVLTWLLYMAFEPYVRRRWPDTLISWTRLLMGRARDPLVGRDLLLGCLFGVAVFIMPKAAQIVACLLGSPVPAPRSINTASLLGGAHLAAKLLEPNMIFLALFNLFVLFAFRLLCRKQWVAVAAYVLVFTLIFTILGSARVPGMTPLVAGIGSFIAISLSAFVLLRFGLLTFTVFLLIIDRLDNLPITIDFSAWYAGDSLIVLLVIVAVAAYGAHTALAGRPLLRHELLDGSA